MAAETELNLYLEEKVKLVDAKLDALLPAASLYPQVIHEAMRTAVFSGGKRIRPLLLLAAAEACAGNAQEALPAACAVEMIHTYSLIHDDLPCMDNDDWRRGRPSCHVQYGEANALLAGDALLTLAFETLSRMADKNAAAAVILEISRAIGTQGMIGGQVIDILCEKQEADLPTLDYVNIHKTGKLIRASCVAGAIACRAPETAQKALALYGEHLGLAFQVIDDIMDGNGYLKFMSAEQARQKASENTEKALHALDFFGSKGEPLRQIAGFLLNRKK